MKKKALYYTLMGIFAAIFIGCAIYIVDYFVQSYENDKLYEQLASMYGGRPSTTRPLPTASSSTLIPTPPATSVPLPSTGSQPSIPSGSTGITGPSIPSSLIPSPPVSDVTVPVVPPLPTEPTEPPAPEMLDRFKDIYALNQHVVGWIEIPGTRVNYPVLQTPNTKQWINYYIDHSFYGESDKYGAIYAREACDVFSPSDNVTIYGHHMYDGKMFGDLIYYDNDHKGFAYYQKHKYIYFDTLYEQHTYQIFAVFQTSGTYGVGFPYHLFVNADSEEEFDEFIATCKSLSEYRITLTPKYGDKIICLSTCSYHVNNGRLVVAAVRID